jgi:hypothetical protein
MTISSVAVELLVGLDALLRGADPGLVDRAARSRAPALRREQDLHVGAELGGRGPLDLFELPMASRPSPPFGA